jgi:hypothetical protein
LSDHELSFQWQRIASVCQVADPVGTSSSLQWASRAVRTIDAARTENAWPTHAPGSRVLPNNWSGSVLVRQTGDAMGSLIGLRVTFRLLFGGKAASPLAAMKLCAQVRQHLDQHVTAVGQIIGCRMASSQRASACFISVCSKAGSSARPSLPRIVVG